MADLHVKTKKQKHKKHKPILDLRRCQLEKLAERLRSDALNEKEFYSPSALFCVRIKQRKCAGVAMFQERCGPVCGLVWSE